MPLRHTLQASLTAVALAVAVPAGAETATYALSLAGIPLGEVTLASERSGSDYAAAMSVTPNGLVAAMTSYSFDGRSSGEIDGEGRLAPLRFTARSSSPRADRRTEIEWRGDVPVRVSVVPPRSSAPDPASVVGALDPVSAGFALLRENDPDDICDADIEVFDGSRRSRLSVAEPVAGERGLTCSGVYARLEGEAHSLSSQREYPFTLTFVPDGQGQVRLERIETRTRFGLALVSRRG
jgi:hypothetical protein